MTGPRTRLPARLAEGFLAFAAPGFVPLLRRPGSIARLLACFAATTGMLNLLLWAVLGSGSIRTFDPLVMMGAQNLDSAFLGTMEDALQAGDALVLVAEVGGESIRFQRLEPIVGPDDPIHPQPHFWPLFASFCLFYAWGVLSSLRDMGRGAPERAP